MRLDEFCVAVRTCGTAHLFELAQIFEPHQDASGEPLLWKISDSQTAEAHAAIETLRKIACDPDLVPNTAATEGRRRQGSTRGKPASAIARAALY